MKITHHGGKNTVTGSCHELRLDKTGILIDCGLFQGNDLTTRGSKALDIDFPIKHIKALLLTHSHIDHIGRIPWLLAAGFKGPIHCTPATAELVPLMLEDGLKLQLGLDKGQRARILQLVKKLIRPIDYNQWVRVNLREGTKGDKGDKGDKGEGRRVKAEGALQQPKSVAQTPHDSPHLKAKPSSPSSLPPSSKDRYIYFRFQQAGHILGSAYIEIKLPSNEIIVFSGDLGPNHTPLLPDPKPPKRADYLYLESTYGNKTHQNVATRHHRLNQIIQRSLKNGGAIIIPAFSVGRTQELLFDIEQLLHQQNLSKRLPIILDSPLATKVTKRYRRYKKLWSREAKQKLASLRNPLAFEQCITIASHKEHLRVVNRLASTSEPAIIIAASGMCQGGRVMNYLKALLADKRTDVIFAGYQAEGTLGRQLQDIERLQRGDKTPTVHIENQSIKVQAGIHSLSGYSAHADQHDLVKFAQGMILKPKHIHLTHGDMGPKLALKNLLNITLANTKVTL